MPKQEEQNKSTNPPWDKETWRKEEESKKEKKDNLKPGEEEAYLLLIALLLIASGPIGIGIAVGLAGTYGGIKAFHIKQYVNKARKIKNQKKLEQDISKNSNVDEDKTLETEIDKQKSLTKSKMQKSLTQKEINEIKTLSDCYENEDDIVKTFANLSDEELNRIADMTEQEIEAEGLDLAKDNNLTETLDEIIALKKELGSKTSEQFTANIENNEQAKSLAAKLNKEISTQNQPNNAFLPSSPSIVEISTNDDSLQKKNEKDREMTRNQNKENPIDITHERLGRHKINFPEPGNPANTSNNVARTSEVQNRSFEAFIQPTNTLTTHGSIHRAKREREQLNKSKSQKEGQQAKINNRRRNSL